MAKRTRFAKNSGVSPMRFTYSRTSRITLIGRLRRLDGAAEQEDRDPQRLLAHGVDDLEHGASRSCPRFRRGPSRSPRTSTRPNRGRRSGRPRNCAHAPPRCPASLTACGEPRQRELVRRALIGQVGGDIQHPGLGHGHGAFSSGGPVRREPYRQDRPQPLALLAAVPAALACTAGLVHSGLIREQGAGGQWPHPDRRGMSTASDANHVRQDPNFIPLAVNVT